MLDRVHDLAGDRHVVGLEDESVERRAYRAFERVLDRHEGQVHLLLLHGEHAVVDRRQRDRLDFGTVDGVEKRLLAEGALGT